MAAPSIEAAFEGAIATTILTHAELDNMPRIRTWRRISEDLNWTPTSDRVFPLFDIRATQSETDGDNGITQQVTVQILTATNANDDQDHASITAYADAAHSVLSALYSQFRAQAAGDERNTFDAYISDKHPAVAALIQIGGFTWGAPLAPYEDGGANFSGENFVIHFSRSDY
jgi:hypothetical protein